MNQNTPWPVRNKSFHGHPKEVLITSSDNWKFAGGIKGERSSSWLKLFFNHAAFLHSLLGTTLAEDNTARPSKTNAFNSYVGTQYEQQHWKMPALRAVNEPVGASFVSGNWPFSTLYQAVSQSCMVWGVVSVRTRGAFVSLSLKRSDRPSELRDRTST